MRAESVAGTMNDLYNVMCNNVVPEKSQKWEKQSCGWYEHECDEKECIECNWYQECGGKQ